MKLEKIDRIFEETAYVRTSGTDAEKKCAEYLKGLCEEMGGSAHLEPFAVEMAAIREAKLFADGREVACRGYLCAGSGSVEAPLYYLRNKDACSLQECRGKIVMVDGRMGYWVYQDILENGAVGFITYDGNANYADREIDQKELRAVVSKGRKIPGVNINVKDAIELIRDDAQTVKILLSQDEYEGESNNVVMDLPGEREEWIVLTAHYDSTFLSQGAYDNMSGCIGLLGIAEHFLRHPHRYGLRFLWCGSEERGLLGSKAYCARHEKELDQIVLDINLDMIGCIMGWFVACCTSEEKLVHYIQYLASEAGFGIAARDGVYASDSTPFADRGIPAVTFARAVQQNVGTIHNSYDTRALMKAAQMQKDIGFIVTFTDRMANARRCPVARQMPDKMKEKLDVYLGRKRPPEKDD